MVSGKAKTAGVIGWPVGHSLSPRLHDYWLRHYAVDGAYIPMAVKPEDLAEAIRSLPKLGFRGVNLTLPHKQTIIPFLDSVEDEATQVGAVNTVVIDAQGKLHGSNTDIHGFIENLRPALGGRRDKAVLLGAGGAARGICHALVKLGFKKIIVVNRTQKMTESLMRIFSRVQAEGWEERHKALANADLLVNSTSLGMTGSEPLTIDLSALPERALVSDIVYKPLLTPLLQQAQARGNPVVDGLGMLIHQAIPGFEAWFGVRPEATAELRRYLLDA